MDPTRRNVLVALGGTAAAGGAALVTGAFDAIRAERTATVSVVGDADTYLALRPIGDPDLNEGEGYHDVDDRDEGGSRRRVNPYAELDDGELALDFADPNDRMDGLNENSETRFHYVFSVVNQGTESVEVSITPERADGTMSEAVTLYDSSGEKVDQFSADLRNIDNRVVPVGKYIPVGVEFDVPENESETDVGGFDVIVEARTAGNS